MTTSQNPFPHPTPCCDRCDFLNETHRPNVPPVEESYSSLASKVFAPFANGIKPSGPPAYEAVKNWNYHDGVEVPVDEKYSPRHAKKTPLVGKLRDLLAAWKSEHPVELPPVEETLRKMAETSTAGLVAAVDGSLDAVEIPTVSKQYVRREALRTGSSDFDPSWISLRVQDLSDQLLLTKASVAIPAGHYLGAMSFCSGVERDVESDTYELIVVMTATYAPVSSVPGVDE